MYSVSSGSSRRACRWWPSQPHVEELQAAVAWQRRGPPAILDVLPADKLALGRSHRDSPTSLIPPTCATAHHTCLHAQASASTPATGPGCSSATHTTRDPMPAGIKHSSSLCPRTSFVHRHLHFPTQAQASGRMGAAVSSTQPGTRAAQDLAARRASAPALLCACGRSCRRPGCAARRQRAAVGVPARVRSYKDGREGNHAEGTHN